MTSWIALEQHLNTNFSIYKSVIHWFLNPDIEISKKNFTRQFSIMGGEKWEWKIKNNFTPKVVLDPNSILKSHHFVIFIMEIEYFVLLLQGHTNCPALASEHYLTTLLTFIWKCWILKFAQGSKTTFGLTFLKIFTSKNMPPNMVIDWFIRGVNVFIR